MSLATLRSLQPGASATDEEKKFFQITLMRSLIGLPSKTRRSVAALGLSKRHQVVWQPFTSPVVGTLLKVKELVTVELVSDIPPKMPTPKGFVKLGNAIGQWSSA
jgi:ribosomal protein L30